jgi:hypothetical protein
VSTLTPVVPQQQQSEYLVPRSSDFMLFWKRVRETRCHDDNDDPSFFAASFDPEFAHIKSMNKSQREGGKKAADAEISQSS